LLIINKGFLMKQFSVLIFAIALLVVSCSDDTNNNPTTSKNYVVEGFAKTVGNEPIEGAEIWVKGLEKASNKEKAYKGFTDKDGKYTFDIPEGEYAISALYSFSFKNHNYILELHSKDEIAGNQPAYTVNKNVRKDFEKRINGKNLHHSFFGATDIVNSYYGGGLIFKDGIEYESKTGKSGEKGKNKGKNEIIDVTIKSVGLMMDNSVATGDEIKLEISTDNEGRIKEAKLADIALGEYEITAKKRSDGKELELSISYELSETDPAYPTNFSAMNTFYFRPLNFILGVAPTVIYIREK